MARIGLILGYGGNGSNLDALVASYEGSTSYGVDAIPFDHKTATNAAELLALAVAAAEAFATANSFTFESLEPAFDIATV